MFGDFLSIWQWFGLGTGALIGLGFIAWYFPPLRRLAVELGVAIIAGLAIYRKGIADESTLSAAKQKAAEDKALKAGTDARASAERDVASGVRDGFDRDKQ